jgi:hypothetical protein
MVHREDENMAGVLVGTFYVSVGIWLLFMTYQIIDCFIDKFQPHPTHIREVKNYTSPDTFVYPSQEVRNSVTPYSEREILKGIPEDIIQEIEDDPQFNGDYQMGLDKYEAENGGWYKYDPK